MKTYTIIGIAFFGISIMALGQVVMPEAILTVRVIDESGQPIEGAKVGIEDDVYGKPPSGGGISDKNGLHTGKLRTWGSLYYGAQMTGYYTAGGEYHFDRGSIGKDPKAWVSTIWAPINPTVSVMLKKQGDTMPMYAKRISIAPPVLDGTDIGFDFVEGDWSAPHGKGKVADIFFSATGSIEKNDLKLTWSFPNEGDGIIVYPYEGGTRSELRSPTIAPETGYGDRITVDSEGRPKGQDGNFRPLSFVFRVRTVLDEDGNIVTAHYGKIYPQAYKIVYYFNPTPNSRAIEYDINRNLFKNLKSYDRINEP